MTQYTTIVIGAGPAGLMTAYQLSKSKQDVLVLETDPKLVGGISRTVNYNGFGIDIGGHRFFSKSQEIEDVWTEILGADLLQRPRSSRIFYNKKLFSYPLKAMEALSKLGVVEATKCVLSYAKARFFPIKNPKSFEDWVSNKFGYRLFSIFFKSYTEKVWGMSCRDISADWAVQRIKGLSLGKAIIYALVPQRGSKSSQHTVKTLIDSFRYPRRGPGMMWEACARKIVQMGNEVRMGSEVRSCSYSESSKLWTVSVFDLKTNSMTTMSCKNLVSSMPLRTLITGLGGLVPTNVARAANELKYRDFLVVAIIADARDSFDDNWIYIHDPNVKVGRIQNFRSWSPEMVPDPNKTCLGLEYFCFEQDDLWSRTDDELIELAKSELESLKLVSSSSIVDGKVIRQAKAYPVYDEFYHDNVLVLREFIQNYCPGLHVVGRNGMHKYNNQDHAMMTGMLTAKNIIAGKPLFDTWKVNEDAEYHEQTTVSSLGGRMIPTKIEVIKQGSDDRKEAA